MQAVGKALPVHILFRAALFLCFRGMDVPGERHFKISDRIEGVPDHFAVLEGDVGFTIRPFFAARLKGKKRACNIRVAWIL